MRSMDMSNQLRHLTKMVSQLVHHTHLPKTAPLSQLLHSNDTDTTLGARPIGRAPSSLFVVLSVSSAEAINAATDSISSTATITLQQLVRWLLEIPQQLLEKDATEACVTIDDGLDKLDFPCSWQCVNAQWRHKRCLCFSERIFVSTFEASNAGCRCNQ